MLSRIAASFAFLMLTFAAVHAQEAQPPARPQRLSQAPSEAQQNQQFKPPAKEDARPSREAPRPAPETPPAQEPPPGQGPPPRAQTRPSERCGAVAYTADGAFGGAYGIDTCEDAERLAIDECTKESTDKADCSRGVIRRTDAWFHVQFCRRGSDWGTHVSTGRTMAEANQAAAQYARTSQYGAENCRVVPNGVFHSGGLHTKM